MKYDKGNGVCLISKVDYMKKLNSIVEDDTKFKVVEKDKRINARHPLLKRIEHIKEIIKVNLKPYIDTKIYNSLITGGNSPGKLYGTCKVHKKDHPLRPIVSMLNTPSYKLAKFIDKMIKPHIPKQYCVENNKEFLEKLSQYEHKDGDYCISFDVVSLFTNVPLNETIEMITNGLPDSNIPKKSLTSLLKCVTGGLFQYNNKLYSQIDGVSMGNPLAPTIANFFMGTLEATLFNKDDVNNPVLYIRYVDDIFCIFRKDVLFNDFEERLNKLHKAIKFTHELGTQENELPFLDIKVKLATGKIITKVHKKEIDTDVILNFSSVAPIKWKRALILWFLNRAKTISSSDALYKQEIINLKEKFVKNGYPKKFVNEIIERFNMNNNRHNEKLKSSEFRNIIRVPYIGKPSIDYKKQLEKLMRNYVEDFKVIFTTTKVSHYFSNKEETPHDLKSNVVYKYKCLKDESIQYIGFTTRPLTERVKEHLRGRTAVSDHIINCNTCKNEKLSVKNFMVLKECKNKFETLINEAILIKRYNPILNKQLTKPGITHTLRIFD